MSGGYVPGDIALINDYSGHGDFIGNLIYDGEKSRYGRADWTHTVGIVSEDGGIVEANWPDIQHNDISKYPPERVTIVHLPIPADDPRRAYAVRFWLSTVGEHYGWLDFVGLAISLAFGLNILVHANRMPICSENCARGTEAATDHGYPYSADAMMPEDLGVAWGIVPAGKPLALYKRWGLLAQTLYWAIAPWKSGLKFTRPRKDPMNASTIDNLLGQIAGLLGPLSPFTKAVVPAALALAVAVVNSLIAGSVNATSLIVAGTGLVAALAAYFLPNKPKSAPAPVAPVKGPGK